MTKVEKLIEELECSNEGREHSGIVAVLKELARKPAAKKAK